jgi:hypothetical protein
MFKCIDKENYTATKENSQRFAFFVMNDARQLMKEIVEKAIFPYSREQKFCCTFTVTSHRPLGI